MPEQLNLEFPCRPVAQATKFPSGIQGRQGLTCEERRIRRRAASKRWLDRHPEFRRVYNRRQYLKNRERRCVEAREYRRKNYTHEEGVLRYAKRRDYVLAYRRKWYREHKAEAAAYRKSLYHNDPLHRLEHRYRCQCRKWLKRSKILKPKTVMEFLGCDIEYLRNWIEMKFQPGMTWDNWSLRGWHIDHIVPISWFDLTDPNQLKDAAHYRNLQPLWAKDNLTKSANLPLARVWGTK